MNHSLVTSLAGIAIMLPAFLIALSFHEFCHALTATLLGDPTPKQQGRLTLNPLAHVDFMGLIFLLVFRFGWAKPVEFDHRNFKRPKLYSILTAFAGPFSNFFLALICFYCIAYLPIAYFSKAAITTFMQILQATAYINIMLGVFNLLPIPPLDGSHVLMVFLNDSYPEAAIWIYRYSFFILIGIFILPQTRMILVKGIMLAEMLLKHLII